MAKDEYFMMRISAERKNQLNSLLELSHWPSKSAFIDRLISSTYYKYFDEKGRLKSEYENKTSGIDCML